MRIPSFTGALLVSAVWLLPLLASAQRKPVVPAPGTSTLSDSLVALPSAAMAEAEATEMCLLNFEGSGNPDTFIDLDFGLGTRSKVYTPGQAELIKKIKATPSAVGALLLLRRQGWELVQTYAGPISATKLSHYFLMRRRGR